MNGSRGPRSGGRGPGGRGRGGKPGGRGGLKGKRRGGKGKRFVRKKICMFCKNKEKHIDYKEADKMRRYTTERGKIIPSRISGNCAKHQRQLARAVKRARMIALLPFVAQ